MLKLLYRLYCNNVCNINISIYNTSLNLQIKPSITPEKAHYCHLCDKRSTFSFNIDQTNIGNLTSILICHRNGMHLRWHVLQSLNVAVSAHQPIL